MVNWQKLVCSLPENDSPWWRQMVLALACTGVAAVVRLALEDMVEGVPFITFFPAVLVASLWGGAAAGVGTLVFGAGLAGYVWLEPPFGLDVTKLGASTLIVFLMAGGILVFLAHLLQTALRMARASEARAELIAREMQHRTGNKLALVQSLARLSVRHATTLDEFQAQFSARLRTLSDAQALSGPDAELPTDLATLVRTVLTAFDEERIDLAGPPAGIESADRPMLALLLHELATNAVKHGALSAPDGRVSIAWSMCRDGIAIEWRESGGPPVREPGHTGFGTGLVRSAFTASRGEVGLDYLPGGIHCTVRLFSVTACEPAANQVALAGLRSR